MYLHVALLSSSLATCFTYLGRILATGSKPPCPANQSAAPLELDLDPGTKSVGAFNGPEEKEEKLFFSRQSSPPLASL